MIRSEKLLKDRKILRKVDVNLAAQGRYIIAANIIMFLFVASVGDYYSSHPRVTTLFGASLFFLSSLTFYLIIRFDSVYGAGPARWRMLFIGSQITTAFYIGSFAASIVLLDKLSVNSFLATLYVVGYSSISNVEWSPYHQRNLIKHLAAFVPIVAAYTVIADVNGVIIAAGLFVLWAMFVRQSKLMNVRHWDNVHAHHELHRKARDLSHAVNMANDASQFKTEFLANITHEIRTPMNNVLGMLALLDDTNLSDQQRELQKVAVHSGEALLSLIDDIVDFSRISSGQVQLNETVFNLKRCIDQTLELLGPRAHENGIELSCVYELEIPVRVRADQGRLAQLINNLVSNAIKYSDGTDVVLRVNVEKTSDRTANLKVTVEDNGKGIDPEQQDRLFEAFSSKQFRSDLVQSGTGLGLAISKGLAECMNGDIGFTSEKNKGTEFWFTVELQLSTQQAQKVSGLQELSNKQALILCQSKAVVESLAFHLSSLDINSTPMQAEEDTLTALLEGEKNGRPFDLLFINLPLSQSVNFELVKNIQSQQTLKDALRVVVLSSLPQRADAVRLGMVQEYDVQWLSKPVTREKLCKTLLRCFEIVAEVGDLDDKADASAEELQGKRILLVEDNAVNQMVARGMLHKLGYVVTSVINGKEALGLLEEKTFDLILMDCMMPILDGYETTKAWREKEVDTDSHIPIIAMTASVVEGEHQKCLAVGMDDYLSKPVNLDELNAKIRLWIGSSNEQASDTVVPDSKPPQSPNSQRKTA